MMKHIYIIGLCLMAFTSFAQNPVITSFQGNGVITWTNNVTNAIYRIEWASTPTGTWYNAWDILRNITVTTNTSMSAPVPMFYRVTMISEAEHLTIFANPTTLTYNGDQTVLTVTGGTPPYTWSTLSGAKGGFIYSDTGYSVVYIRNAQGNNSIKVIDAVGDYAWIVINQP
jgi:hypothetical protein